MPSAGTDWVEDPAYASTRRERGTRSAHYRLSPFIYPCSTPDGWVLLDLLENRYIGLGPVEAQILSELTQSTRSELNSAALSLSNERREAVACELVEAGILNRETTITGPIHARAVDVRGQFTAIGEELASDVPITRTDVANFARAYAAALFQLRFVRFVRVVHAVSARRAIIEHRDPQFDVVRATETVSVFRRVRPFAFTAKGKCLLHALTLTHFLAQRGVAASWVIGIKTVPWAAHSWVQHDRFLLDTTPEKVCGYTPILAV